MATTPYVDPNSVHIPATGNVPPANWGTTVRNNFQTVANPPGCAILTLTNHAISPSTWTNIPFADPDHRDTDNYHSVSVNNDRITIPTGLGGVYDLGACVSWGTTVAGTQFRSRIMLNGTTTVCEALFSMASTPKWYVVQEPRRVFKLNAGDYLQLQVWHNDSAALNLIANYYSGAVRMEATWRGVA